MFAVVGIWSEDPTYAEAQSRGLREDVLPIVTSAPGFVSGHWAGADGSGSTFIVFEEKAQAEYFREMVLSRADKQAEVGIVNRMLEIHALYARA